MNSQRYKKMLKEGRKEGRKEVKEEGAGRRKWKLKHRQC
jgi:hypothetical protein